MLMVLYMKENGLKITKKDSEEKFGTMAAATLATTTSQPSKVTDTIIGKTAILIWAIGTRIKLMVKESLYGLIKEFTPETGTMARFMELVLIFILTRDSIMVITRTIKNRAMAAIFMEMVELILVSGKMENRMVRDIWFFLMGL